MKQLLNDKKSCSLGQDIYELLENEDNELSYDELIKVLNAFTCIDRVASTRNSSILENMTISVSINKGK